MYLSVIIYSINLNSDSLLIDYLDSLIPLCCDFWFDLVFWLLCLLILGFCFYAGILWTFPFIVNCGLFLIVLLHIVILSASFMVLILSSAQVFHFVFKICVLLFLFCFSVCILLLQFSYLYETGVELGFGPLVCFSLEFLLLFFTGFGLMVGFFVGL